MPLLSSCEMEIRCSHCGETKSLENFAKQKNRKNGRTSWCLTCRNAAARSWRSRLPPERKAPIWRKDNLRKNYGMTHEDYSAMLASQGGKCAICAKPPAEGKNLHVDHNHESGEVRS